jgi:hypothetical protein
MFYLHFQKMFFGVDGGFGGWVNDTPWVGCVEKLMAGGRGAKKGIWQVNIWNESPSRWVCIDV